MKPARLLAGAALLTLLVGHPLSAWAQEGTRVAVTSDDAAARNYFTDLPVLNQDGKELRFYSDVLKDRVVLINFIYTHCPDACPLVGKKLSQAQALLGEAFGTRIHFVSVSVDPDNDTPQALRKYAAAVAARPGWIFLTGKNTETVVRKLGQFTADAEDHSMILILGNVKTGHWMKLRPDSSVPVIAEQLRRLAAEEGDRRNGS